MNLNKFAREVHANACAHGWWDEERDTAEIIALIHSEWSEALEEYRAGRPMVWHKCVAPIGIGSCCENGGRICDRASCYFDKNCMDSKPEGIAVELIDGCIRILDFAAHEKVSLKFENIEELFPNFPTQITALHYYTSSVMNYVGSNGKLKAPNRIPELLGEMIDNVFKYIRTQGLDPEKIMREKHEYNKTRPYRHGGKKC